MKPICGRGQNQYRQMLKICVFLTAAYFFFLIPGFCAQDEFKALKEQARIYCDQGWRLQKEGNLDAAISYYQKAIVLDPGYAVAYNDLGIIFEAKDRPEEAKEMYLKAINIAPDSPYGYSNLALLYETQGDYLKALAYWTKRLTAGNPQDIYAILAKKHIDEIKRLHPEAYLKMREQHQEDWAKEKTPLRQEDTDLAANSRGLKSRNAQLETKLKDLSTQLASKTENLSDKEQGAELTKASLQELKNKLESANQEYLALKKEKGQLQDDITLVKKDKAQLKADLETNLAKITDLNAQLQTKAKELSDKEQEAELTKASLRELKNKLESANQECVALNKENAQLQNEIALLKKDKEKLQAEAPSLKIADLATNTIYKSEMAKLCRELGTAYTKAKLFDLAIEAYLKSLELNPNDAATHYNLGIVYRHFLKDSQKAAYHLKKYLQLNSKSPNRKEVEYLIKMLEG